eukprot:5835552-Pleurochrysis_carterae.AAC.2
MCARARARSRLACDDAQVDEEGEGADDDGGVDRVEHVLEVVAAPRVEPHQQLEHEEGEEDRVNHVENLRRANTHEA